MSEKSNFLKKSENELISIVMPVKNAALYLSDCLKSIINQTIKNWELVAINDHSNDDSAAILSEFALKDDRIKSFNNNGEGIIKALQLAYSKCKGNFITRMDADDIMVENKLEVLYQALLKNGWGSLAIGQVKYFSNEVLGEGYQNYANWLNELTLYGNNFNELYKECVIPSPSWMLHKIDFEKCGGFKSETYPEDYDLCFRFYQAGLTCIPCEEIIHHWRDYPERTSRNDEHYADNRFLDLKCFYFLQLNRDENRPLIIWGAGKKGKAIAKYFIDENVKLSWLCNNENKIGHTIYGIKLQSVNNLSNFNNPQIVISVANPSEQTDIKKALNAKQFRSMDDYFFFC